MSTNGRLTDNQLDRYARHIVLREIGGPGQKRLLAAKVLVIGAGGLGSSALMYLAAAGVGTIGIVDDDAVSLSNLQRQVLHTTDQVGAAKTESAKAALAKINPDISVVCHHCRILPQNAQALVGAYDLVLDGSDNFDTRYLLNEVCVSLQKPLISAAMGQWEGQISTYKPWKTGPCYACVFPERPADGLAPSCAQAGVVGALAGVMGSMQALEAIKEITGAGAGLAGRMMLFDGLYAENRVVELVRRDACPVCQS